jgi:hypothetical protein
VEFFVPLWDGCGLVLASYHRCPHLLELRIKNGFDGFGGVSIFILSMFF